MAVEVPEKLCLLAPEFLGIGGLASYHRSIVSALAPRGVQVLSYDRSERKYELPENVTHFTSTPSRSAFAARAIQAYLRAEPSVFLVGHVGLSAPFATVPRQRQHRMILLIAGIEAWHRLPWRHALALDRMDTVVFIAQYNQELFLQYNREQLRSDARFEVIWLTAGPEQEARRIQPFPTVQRRTVLCISRLNRAERLKGIDVLVRAAASLNPNAWRVVIVGDGDGRAELQTLAERVGVTDRVEFPGWICDESRSKLIDDCHMLCLPSAQEGFGLVFTEAMVQGRPCVGAAAGAAPEVVPPEVGEVVPFGDAALLAAALHRISERIDRRELTPKQIRQVYDERYAWSRFRRNWAALLGNQDVTAMPARPNAQYVRLERASTYGGLAVNAF